MPDDGVPIHGLDLKSESRCILSEPGLCLALIASFVESASSIVWPSKAAANLCKSL